ncbi:MAG: lipid-A-disaccharide synthase N-terminal domain-containing protein [Bacteroidales bacterium]|nr:lipid-A-disaccharide synthase N-terminal domain-containing protein [Bacteroidales bacterium]
MIYVIGFLAQALFSARILVQWIMSERAKRVLSPSIFWELSLAAAYLLCIYGWLRHDFAIVLGQFISYYIYLWNLNMKGVWRRIPWIFRAALVLTPIVAIGFVIDNFGTFVNEFFRNEDIPIGLLVYGSAGQVLFTLRFIYQWLYSSAEHESMLPPGFWIISLAGSIIIVSYAIVRLDPVLILGQACGLVAYIRNLIIGIRQKQNPEKYAKP